MKIIVLDGRTLNPGDNPWDPLAVHGTLEVFDRTSLGDLVARAQGAEIVVTNKTRVPAEALAQLPDLRLISVLATGYDNVDVAAAATHGVRVCNVPGYATDSVAQHAFALLLELCHRTARHDDAVKNGAWRRNEEFSFWLAPPVELSSLTFGVVGYGRIGRRAADLARAFGMNVSCATRTPTETSAAELVSFCSLEDLFARSDVISLHSPLTAETEHLVNAGRLRRMKPSAFLINTARGGLIDESALALALRERRIAGAGLDTLTREPPPDDHPLLSEPRCIVTPHMAWASLAARRRLMLATAENIRAFVSGRPINLVA